MHVRNARKGIEEMIRVVRSGGCVIASELDAETFFIDTPHAELTRRLFTSFADAAASPRVGRSLARLMRQSGLKNVKSQAAAINSMPFNMARIGFGGHVDKCVQEGLLSTSDADRWWQALEEANGVGEFHGGAIVFTVAGDKP